MHFCFFFIIFAVKIMSAHGILSFGKYEQHAKNDARNTKIVAIKISCSTEAIYHRERAVIMLTKSSTITRKNMKECDMME